MSAHRSRVGPPAILGGPCDHDCPACAEERELRIRTSDGVRTIVLGMWLEAIESGERSVERALRDIIEPISALNGLEGATVLSEFVHRALAIKAGPKPRGLPSAWHKTNSALVDLVKREEALPSNNVTTAKDTGIESVFVRVAAIWRDWKIDVSSRQVQDSYYATTN